MNIKLKDLRKNQIMRAAEEVVIAKGYDQSRVDDIVKKSKLSKGAIYWYYNSKKEIYLSLVDHWFIEYSNGLQNIIEKETAPSNQLKLLFNYFFEQFSKNPSTFKILVEFWRMSGLDSDFNIKLQDVYSHFLKYITDIIIRGIAIGEFKKVEPKITALSILINIEGIHWFTLFNEPKVEANEYINTISDFILNGLKKKKIK